MPFCAFGEIIKNESVDSGRTVGRIDYFHVRQNRMAMAIARDAVYDGLTLRQAICELCCRCSRNHIGKLNCRVVARVDESDGLREFPAKGFRLVVCARSSDCGIVFVSRKCRGDCLKRLTGVASH